MPKIIENVRTQLLAEAKRQIIENGYSQTTVRSVSKACGLAVGTVYNYFQSKDMLIAAVMMGDWRICMERIKNSPSNDAETLFRCVYDALIDFEGKYRELFADANATKVFASVFAERHRQLCDKLAVYLFPVCPETEDRQFLSLFLAEAFLSWTMANASFEQLLPVLLCLVRK